VSRNASSPAISRIKAPLFVESHVCARSLRHKQPPTLARDHPYSEWGPLQFFQNLRNSYALSVASVKNTLNVLQGWGARYMGRDWPMEPSSAIHLYRGPYVIPRVYRSRDKVTSLGASCPDPSRGKVLQRKRKSPRSIASELRQRRNSACVGSRVVCDPRCMGIELVTDIG